MGITKSSTVVHDDITLSNGDLETVSSTVDLTDKSSATARVRITNAAVPLSVPAYCRMEASEEDALAKFTLCRIVRGEKLLTDPREWTFPVPRNASYVRFVSGGNVGADVTLRVVLDIIDSHV